MNMNNLTIDYNSRTIVLVILYVTQDQSSEQKSCETKKPHRIVCNMTISQLLTLMHRKHVKGNSTELKHVLLFSYYLQ